MVGTDGQADVDTAASAAAASTIGFARFGGAGEFAAGEAFAEAVKGVQDGNRGASALLGLLDSGAAGLISGAGGGGGIGGGPAAPRRHGRRAHRRERLRRPPRAAGTVGGVVPKTRARPLHRALCLRLAFHGGVNDDLLIGDELLDRVERKRRIEERCGARDRDVGFSASAVRAGPASRHAIATVTTPRPNSGNTERFIRALSR